LASVERLYAVISLDPTAVARYLATVEEIAATIENGPIDADKAEAVCS